MFFVSGYRLGEVGVFAQILFGGYLVGFGLLDKLIGLGVLHHGSHNCQVI